MPETPHARRESAPVAARIAIVVFWLGMMAWLLRYEAFPERFTHSLEGYRSLLSRDVLIVDSWMKILFNGSPIGYARTSVDINEADPAQRYEVDNTLHLRLNFMGERRDIHAEAAAWLDVTYRLQRFDFSLSSAGYHLEMEGARKTGADFSVRIKTGGRSEEQVLRIPDDVVLYSPMTEMALKRLKPGDQMVVRTLDPASLSTADVRIRALRREPLRLEGTNRMATVLSVEYRGLAVLSWIDEEGLPLRQETPFGWVMERCSRDEASRAMKAADEGVDILAGMAVPVTGRIRRPRECRLLRLRLRGVAFAASELSSDRQTVLRLDGTNAEIRVEAGDASPALAAAPTNLASFLRATPALQSEHPDLVAKAREITAASRTPEEKARAIGDWVYRNVAKQTTISLPSALDVLKTLAGDCNEHTYLFAALARAAGLPSRIHAGLAYHEGAFYYHAWPDVWTGRWLEMDPTWGQPAVDATHISLAEGELGSQLQLVKVLGRLKIEVLEER